MANSIRFGEYNIDKIYLGDTPVDKIYLGEELVWPTSVIPAQQWMAEKYMNGGLLVEFEATLPWRIANGATVIADFTDFSTDGLTASYTFYKDATTTLNENAVYNGASPEYENVDGYNWKFSVPEPYKIKVEQTTAEVLNYWTIIGKHENATIFSDEKDIGDSYTEQMGIFTIPKLPQLGATLSGTTMGGTTFNLNIGEYIDDTITGLTTRLCYTNQNTITITYNI